MSQSRGTDGSSHTISIHQKALLTTWQEAFSLRESRTVSRDVFHICEHPNKRSWHICKAFFSLTVLLLRTWCANCKHLSGCLVQGCLLASSYTNLVPSLAQKDLLWKFWCSWRACYWPHFPLCCLVRASKKHNACSSSPQFFWKGPIFFFFFSLWYLACTLWESWKKRKKIGAGMDTW